MMYVLPNGQVVTKAAVKAANDLYLHHYELFNTTFTAAYQSAQQSLQKPDYPLSDFEKIALAVITINGGTVHYNLPLLDEQELLERGAE